MFVAGIPDIKEKEEEGKKEAQKAQETQEAQTQERKQGSGWWGEFNRQTDRESLIQWEIPHFMGEFLKAKDHEMSTAGRLT